MLVQAPCQNSTVEFSHAGMHLQSCTGRAHRRACASPHRFGCACFTCSSACVRERLQVVSILGSLQLDVGRLWVSMEGLTTKMLCHGLLLLLHEPSIQVRTRMRERVCACACMLCIHLRACVRGYIHVSTCLFASPPAPAPHLAWALCPGPTRQ